MADSKRDRWKNYTLDGAVVDGPSMLWTQKDKARLPSSVDLRSEFGPVFDQEWLPTGSVACAVTAVAEFTLRRQPHKGPWSPLSVLFTHWQAAFIASKRKSAPNQKAHVRMADGVMGLMRVGAYRESDWPSRPDRSKLIPDFGVGHLNIEFAALDHADVWAGADGVARTLAEGRPVLFVYAGPEKLMREAALTGEMQDHRKPLPKDARAGHAMVVVGYEQSGDVLIVRNSFGADWGDGGHMRMPLTTFLTTAANVMAFGPMEANRATKLVAGARHEDPRLGGADRRLGSETYPGEKDQDAGHRKFIDALIGTEIYPGANDKDAGHKKFIEALIGSGFAGEAEGDHNHRRFIDTLMSAGLAPASGGSLANTPDARDETDSRASSRLDDLRGNLRRELSDEGGDAARDFRSRLRRREDEIADKPPRGGGRDDDGRGR